VWINSINPVAILMSYLLRALSVRGVWLWHQHVTTMNLFGAHSVHAHDNYWVSYYFDITLWDSVVIWLRPYLQLDFLRPYKSGSKYLLLCQILGSHQSHELIIPLIPRPCVFWSSLTLKGDGTSLPLFVDCEDLVQEPPGNYLRDWDFYKMISCYHKAVQFSSP